MKRGILVLSALLCCLCLQAAVSYALDWKEIHEEADRTEIHDAVTKAKKTPKSVDSLYLLALVFLNFHEDDKAQDVFDEMLKLNPGSIEAEWGKAEVLRRKYKLEESRQILKEIINSTPEFTPAIISLAYIKYTTMDFKGAEKLAHDVIEKGRQESDLSNYTRSYLISAGAKGMIAYNGGPIAKLIHGTAVFPTLKKAQKLQPNSAAVLYGLGSFYFLAPAVAGGDIDKAESYLMKAIEVDPLFADAYVRLGQVFKAKGDIKKYESFLNKALEIEPQNALALDIKEGRCYFICISTNK